MLSRFLACTLAGALMLSSAYAQETHRAVLSTASPSALDGVPLEVVDVRPEFPAEGDLPARGTSLAEAVLQALRSQNTIRIDQSPADELDAYLRYPSAEPSESGLLELAGYLYDGATALKSSRYDLVVDPFKMQCRLRIKLNRLVSK